eukprot:349729_1
MSSEIVWFLFTEACFNYLIQMDTFNFINNGCPAFAMSKFLTTGVSELTLLIETFSISTTTSYFYRSRFPLSTYGLPIVFAQNIIVLSLIGYYMNEKRIIMSICVCILMTFQILSLNEYFPFIIIEIIYSFQIITVIGGVLPQIYKIFIEKSTGELAFITVSLSFFGCFARLFTTLQEVDDSMAVVLICTSTTMRGILFSQFFIYWNYVKPENDDKKHK